MQLSMRANDVLNFYLKILIFLSEKLKFKFLTDFKEFEWF